MFTLFSFRRRRPATPDPLAPDPLARRRHHAANLAAVVPALVVTRGAMTVSQAPEATADARATAAGSRLWDGMAASLATPWNAEVGPDNALPAAAARPCAVDDVRA